MFRPELFNTLGVKLAAAAGVPAFPIAIKTDFWGEEGLFRGFGPMRPERGQHQAILEFIESRLRLWQESPAACRDAP